MSTRDREDLHDNEEMHRIAGELRWHAPPGTEVSGEDAIELLAWLFADETHGNYDHSTLYLRADVGRYFDVTLRKKEPPKQS